MPKPKFASSNKDELVAHAAAQQTKYDPAEFLIPARDKDGASTRIQCRVQPAYERAIDAAFYSRRFPFRTPSDIIRWAIHSGLKRLEVMEDIPSVTTQVELMNTILRDEEFQLEFQDFVQHANTVVQRHIGAGDYGEARRLIAKLRREIAKMPDGHWKRKYERLLKTQFAHLLDGKTSGKVLLGAFPETDDDDDTDADHDS